MTQIQQIDVSGEEWNENSTEIIDKWGALMVLNAEGEDTGISCHGFAALYRKGGRNYIWRGNFVPSTVRLRLLENNKEGTMILYKAGCSSKRDFATKYPLRLSGNRYSFVTGNPAHLYLYARANALEVDFRNPAFLLWAGEHLKDYSTLWFNARAQSFQKRCWYAWLLDSMSLEDYETFYATQLSEDGFEGVARAAYMVWKDGVVTKFWQMGASSEIHLNI